MSRGYPLWWQVFLLFLLWFWVIWLFGKPAWAQVGSVRFRARLNPDQTVPLMDLLVSVENHESVQQAFHKFFFPKRESPALF